MAMWREKKVREVRVDNHTNNTSIEKTVSMWNKLLNIYTNNLQILQARFAQHDVPRRGFCPNFTLLALRCSFVWESKMNENL